MKQWQIDDIAEAITTSSLSLTQVEFLLTQLNRVVNGEII